MAALTLPIPDGSKTLEKVAQWNVLRPWQVREIQEECMKHVRLSKPLFLECHVVETAYANTLGKVTIKSQEK